MGIAFKDQIRQRTKTQSSLEPAELAGALLASLPVKFDGTELTEVEQAQVVIASALDRFDYRPVEVEAQQLARQLGIDADSPNYLALCDEILRNYAHIVKQAKRLSEKRRIDFLEEDATRLLAPTPTSSGMFFTPATAASSTGKALSVWAKEFLHEIADTMPEDRDDGDHRAALDVLLAATEDCDAGSLTNKAVRATSTLLLKLDKLRESHELAAIEQSHLFSSLQHRAFRGEL